MPPRGRLRGVAAGSDAPIAPVAPAARPAERRLRLHSAVAELVRITAALITAAPDERPEIAEALERLSRRVRFIR